MSGKTVFAALILALSAGGAGAQGKVQTTTSDDIYCSGVISTEKVPEDTFLTTGEGSNYKITFQQGDYVYINKGASQGVKVGDEFSVIRPVLESVNEEWSKWQFSIMKKLGTVWEDEGQVKVVVAQPNVSMRKSNIPAITCSAATSSCRLPSAPFRPSNRKRISIALRRPAASPWP